MCNKSIWAMLCLNTSLKKRSDVAFHSSTRQPTALSLQRALYLCPIGAESKRGKSRQEERREINKTAGNVWKFMNFALHLSGIFLSSVCEYMCQKLETIASLTSFRTWSEPPFLVPNPVSPLTGWIKMQCSSSLWSLPTLLGHVISHHFRVTVYLQLKMMCSTPVLYCHYSMMLLLSICHHMALLMSMPC